MKNRLYTPFYFTSLIIIFFIFQSCKSEESDDVIEGDRDFSISYIRLGSESISSNQNVSLAESITVGFSEAVQQNTNGIQLTNSGNDVQLTSSQSTNNSELTLTPSPAFQEGESYQISFNDQIKSVSGSSLIAKTYLFSIEKKKLNIESISDNGTVLLDSKRNIDIRLEPEFLVTFTSDVTTNSLRQNIALENYSGGFSINTNNQRTFTIKPTTELDYWKKFVLKFDSGLGQANNREFDEKSYELFSDFDPTPKFSALSDDDLLQLIQEQTFKYFWDFGHPNSGMARERNTSGDVVTTGGTGFGLMAMVVAVERGFISRSEAIARWQRIVAFLENADRFHGAWPHWLNGSTGKVQPFSQKDNGADLVETAFLIQGLLTVKEYLDPSNATESNLSNKINTLWEGVEWSWFTKNNENVLYWHWSPEFNWEINLPIRGHNETQLVYVLAAASPTHPITKEVYSAGYTRNGSFVNGNNFYDFELPLGNDLGGPLFFAHYSYLGLDPRNLSDSYTSYLKQNENHSLINYQYSVDNPKNFIGYSSNCWGLTASDNHEGYSAHSPTNDLGVITPTAAISSLPYTPKESLAAMKFFYFTIGDRIWGEYGFYDAFNPTEEWYANSYLAIDQGPIVCMIENHRTGLLWNTFMKNTDVKKGLDLLGFSY